MKQSYSPFRWAYEKPYGVPHGGNARPPGLRQPLLGRQAGIQGAALAPELRGELGHLLGGQTSGGCVAAAGGGVLYINSAHHLQPSKHPNIFATVRSTNFRSWTSNMLNVSPRHLSAHHLQRSNSDHTTIIPKHTQTISTIPISANFSLTE